MASQHGLSVEDAEEAEPEEVDALFYSAHRALLLARGYTVLRSCLPSSLVASLAESIQRELASGCGVSCGAESGAASSSSIDLTIPSSWPKGRRVVETVPPGHGVDSGAWIELASSQKLTRALDCILGQGKWTLPLNPSASVRDEAIARGDFVRHWYCPVVFPEGSHRASTTTTTTTTKGEATQRKRKNEDRDEETQAPSSPSSSWTERELTALRNAVASNLSWEKVAKAVGGTRTAAECKAKYSVATPWTEQEEASLSQLIASMGGATVAATAPARIACEFQRNSRRPKKQVMARVRELASAAAEASATSEKPSSPAASWTAVNRRNRPHQGWHIDIGPGFDPQHARVATGHEFQGVVVLVLLSDWEPGGGGTAVVVGSHKWVHDRLVAAGDVGIAHDELSAWAQARVAAAIHSGSLAYHRDAIVDESNAVERIEQITGRAGDVAILHPLAVHSGTTNHSVNVPRLMANGMVRIQTKSFVKDGHPLLPRMIAADGACETDDASVEFERSVLASARGGSASALRLTSPDELLPSVSVILPVHNAAKWLDECLGSLLAQTHRGPIELSAYDDGSTDASGEMLRIWACRLRDANISVVLSGGTGTAYGCGGAKNAAIRQSSGSILVFLDADDVMAPDRIAASVAALAKHPRALVGCAWQRMPTHATAHYSQWANHLSAEALLAERFRETTVQMPTWTLRRDVFDATGPFETELGEDHEWLLRHLGSRGTCASAVLKYDAVMGNVEDIDVFGNPAAVALARINDTASPLMLYRWRAESESGKTSRRRLMEIKAAAIERDVLTKAPFCNGFTIWGAGRDARALFAALSPRGRGKVRAMIDIDPRKFQGRDYANHTIEAPNSCPVVAPGDERAKPPCLVAVAIRRGSECAEGGSLEERVARAFHGKGGDVLYLC